MICRRGFLEMYTLFSSPNSKIPVLNRLDLGSELYSYFIKFFKIYSTDHYNRKICLSLNICENKDDVILSKESIKDLVEFNDFFEVYSSIDLQSYYLIPKIIKDF